MVRGLHIAQCPSRASNPTPVSCVTSPADLGGCAQRDWAVFASHHPGADVMSLTMHSRVKNADAGRTHTNPSIITFCDGGKSGPHLRAGVTPAAGGP